MDVASSNIANVSPRATPAARRGRRRRGLPTQPAMWSRYDGAGDGVKVTCITRMADELLDVRARREHGNQAYLDIRQASPRAASRAASASPATRRLRRARRLPQLLARPGQQPEQRLGPRPGARPAPPASPTRSVPRPATSRPRRATSGCTCSATSPRSTPSPAAWPPPTSAIAAGNLNGNDVGVLLDKRDQLAHAARRAHRRHGHHPRPTAAPTSRRSTACPWSPAARPAPSPSPRASTPDGDATAPR